MSEPGDTPSEQAEAEAKDEGDDEQKGSTTILAQSIQNAVNEFERSNSGLFLSGLSAGLDIGFGPLLMAVVLTLLGTESPEAFREFALANSYAVGFVFVIIGRSELFTEHTTLAVLPVLDDRASLADLGRLWGVVYAGNIVGGTAFAFLAVTFAPEYGIAETVAFAEIAGGLVDHSAVSLLTGGILAGWLMGLLAWLVIGARETVSRLLLVWLVTLTIGLMHLPHSIAGNVEVLAGLFASDAVGYVDYGRFIVTATVGNAVGGAVFVALLKYGHVVRGGD
jgi:formate/nitrite transporter FocA (FNT family)